VFEVTPDGKGLPALDDPVFHEQQRREVLTGCYELLLVLAEATAQSLSRQAEQDRPGLARQALELLDRADRLGLKTRAIHQRRAHYLLQAGDREGARREQERGAAVPPSGALDHFLLGQENLHRGQWPDAVTAFEKVLQEQPRHFWGQYYLALCRLKQQRPDLAVPGLTACLGQRADFPWLYLLRGAARGELGQHAAAESDFAAAEKLGGGDSVRYVLLMHRGVLRVRQGQSEQAIADLKAAIALRPKQYQGYVNLSQAYLRAGKLDQAVAELDQAIACAGQLGSLYRTRARVQLLRRQETQALADLERAYQLDRDAPPELRASDQRERARLFLRRKEYARALEACDQALRLQADGRGQRLRAEALLGLGRHAEAAACLDACLQKQPNDVEVLCARASMRTRLGQYQGAQADYSRALELKPAADIYAARGWTYLLTDTPKLAILDFEAALRLEPDRGDALAGRGLARVQLGQALQAVQDAQEALRKGPPSARLSYNAARILAQAALRVDRRSASADEYTRRALELLEDALNRLPPAERAEFWKNCVQADTVLRPLRWTPSYRRLAALHVN
jgi:tetratricopeptide (TPR) repeat protein